MGGRSIRDVLFVGLDVLQSKLDDVTNVVTVVLGDSINSAPSSQGVEWWYPPGYIAIPAEPTKGEPSAQAMGLRQGDRDLAFGCRDVRFAKRYRNMRPGEVAIYATAGAARIVEKSDGTVTIYTTDDNTDDGKAVFFTVGPEGFKFVAPFGSFEFDVQGWRIRHGGGFSLRAGSIGGLPGPLAALSSYFNVTSSIQKFQAPLVFLGNGPDFHPAVFVFAENPLTTPGVPLTAPGFMAPWGGFSTASVRISRT